MASTADLTLTKEETLTLETSSPSKRKLSHSLEESNTKQSPAKIAKLESPLKDNSIGSVPAETTALKLQFEKLSDKAQPLVKGSNDDDGFELKSAYNYVVPKGGSCKILTDLKIVVPRGTYGFVVPRSGLALKDKIGVRAGVIGQDDGGNVGVILFNYGDEDFTVAEGDGIAQLICAKIESPEIEEDKALDETERGEESADPQE